MELLYLTLVLNIINWLQEESEKWEFYAEVVPFHEDVDKILAREPKGIILSGGPASVYAEGAPSLDIKLFEQNIPILGLCYGMQLITHLHGGKVARADKQEFGKAELELDDKDNCLYKNIPNKNNCLDESWGSCYWNGS